MNGNNSIIIIIIITIIIILNIPTLVIITITIIIRILIIIIIIVGFATEEYALECKSREPCSLCSDKRDFTPGVGCRCSPTKL